MRIRLFLLSCFLVSPVFASNHHNNMGEDLYVNACKTCHAADKATAIGAPVAFDKAAWKKRLAEAKQQAKQDARFKDKYAYLLYQVKIGKGLMHHGGLCLEAKPPKRNCTDDAYIAAIKYMSDAKMQHKEK